MLKGRPSRRCAYQSKAPVPHGGPGPCCFERRASGAMQAGGRYCKSDAAVMDGRSDRGPDGIAWEETVETPE